MRYFGLVGSAVLVSILGACDRDRETTAAAPTSVSDPLPRGAPAASPSDAPAPDDAPPAPPALAVGDHLAPLPQLAALGRVPRLLVVGSSEALAAGETWRDLDAMARLYADNGLAALAIVVAYDGGTPTPPKDPSAIATQIEIVRKRGRIAMSVAVATDAAALVGVGADPSVVLVDGDDTVRFVGGAGPHWRDLDVAIAALLATNG